MKYLYHLPLPGEAQTSESDQLGTELAESGLLSGDGSVVDALSTSAADIRITGQFRAGEKYAPQLADELEDLASSSLENLPLFRTDRRYSSAGYYELANADVSPAHPQTTSVFEYELSLREVGTKNSHYRALATKPRQLDHEFGNDLDALLTLPKVARKTRWSDPEDQTVASATPTDTRETEFGDVEIYDVEDGETAVGTDTPTLIYELDYVDEAETGLRVYDTLGHAEKADDDGVRQWEVVTWTRHDLDDAVVLDSGALRVEIDEHAGTIDAEEWDGAGWVDVGLTNDSDWLVYDVDLVRVGMVTATAQLTLEDESEGELFVLGVTLQRGDSEVLVDIPDGETGPVPAGIEDWLEPIASERLVDAQPSKGLVSRSEVRR